MKYIQEIYSDDTLSDEKKYLTYQFFFARLSRETLGLISKIKIFE